jgi:hypothetical protein
MEARLICHASLVSSVCRLRLGSFVVGAGPIEWAIACGWAQREPVGRDDCCTGVFQ